MTCGLAGASPTLRQPGFREHGWLPPELGTPGSGSYPSWVSLLG